MLLLHGFPSAMFRDLMPLLADRFHAVAPDYPGMGASAAPAADKFTPSFDNLAAVMADFADKLNLSRYILYMQDFGGPVGMRMAGHNPERVSGLIIQNTPVWQDYLKSRQPRTLVVWGRNDPIFSAHGGDIVKTPIPDADARYYDMGHFAPARHGADIAGEIRSHFP